MNPLNEKWPLILETGYCPDSPLIAQLESQRNTTLYQVAERLLELGVLSSDRQYRAAVNAFCDELIERSIGRC